MKHKIRWKARTISDNELVRDETTIDNQDRDEAIRIFEKTFNFNRYKTPKITAIKEV